MNKTLKAIFFVFVCLSTAAALWVSKDLLFPFVTTKAFFFRIFIELALPFYLFFLVTEKGLRPNLKNPLSVSIVIFTVINFISAFSGVDVNHSLWGNFERMGGAYYIAHLAALYFYVVCLGQMGSKYLQSFLKVLLTVALVVVGNGIFGWLGLPTLVIDPSLPVRVSSTLGNPIYLGSFLIVPMYLSLFFASQTHNKFASILYYVMSFLFLAGIFLSGTRGAVVGILLASFIGAITYLLFTKKQKIKTLGFLVVGLLVICAAVLFNFNNKLPQGSTIQRVFKLKDSNTESRLLQWRVALTGYKDRPILGTGPENYYLVANQYYNPEIYQYDGSWFDKPHNYILEILVTDGILGLMAYLSILVFIVLAFYKGFKSGLYGLAELCFLLTALMAYQIQNLFVFDTVPASLMFFSFVGLGGFIWGASTNTNQQKKSYLENTNFAYAVFIVALLVVAYAEYATNFVPMAIAKNVNYGYAYAQASQPEKAYGYFQKAISAPFNFDKTETATKFSDFSTGFARTANSQNQELAIKLLQESTNYLNVALDQQPKNPILWQRLSTQYLFMSSQVGNKVIVNSKAIEAVNTAISLVPRRNEAYLALAQIYGLEGNLIEAQKIMENAVANLPTDRNAKLQLANLYKVEGKTDLAVKIMEDLQQQGYLFGSYTEVKWLIDYYTLKKDFDKAIALQLQAAKVEPQNINVVVDLAKLYQKAGQIEEARNLAQNIIKFDASKKDELQPIINSPTTATSNAK